MEEDDVIYWLHGAFDRGRIGRSGVGWSPSAAVVPNSLALESGDVYLLENSDYLLLESA